VIPLTLVIGGDALRRESAIAAHRDTSLDTAVILEGLPSGAAALEESDMVQVARIAPGCMCCTGNLTLRVTLNRILRRRPQRIYIALATSDHLDTFRRFLSSAPYDDLLTLTQDLQV
jgi:hypothetical protein